MAMPEMRKPLSGDLTPAQVRNVTRKLIEASLALAALQLATKSIAAQEGYTAMREDLQDLMQELATECDFNLAELF
jgi:hypothetical protein